MQTSWGEAVFCSCGRMLLASPDDDVDPVNPLRWYDPAIYHKFARPAAWEAPKQRTLSRTPAVNDWVVVRDYVTTLADGVTQDLDGAEGRVVKIDGQVTTVALSDGIAGSSQGEKLALVPTDHAHIMIFDTLRKGDHVTIVRGQSAGHVATVVAFKSGMVDVMSKGDLLTVPIERLEKIHTQENI